ncbi:conserved exported hypothetical protein [Gammaproteobacteria bacterium]
MAKWLVFILLCPLGALADNDHKFYLGIEGGYSLSTLANLSVNESPNSASGFVWDHPANGWDSRLGNTFEYGIVAGYNCMEALSLELAYNNRPSFYYEKAQIKPSGDIGNRTRYFDLQNQTLVLNGVVHLASVFNALQSLKTRSRVEPFISLGAGVAKNTVSNFHSLGTDKVPGLIFSKMVDKITYNFAAQAGLGLNFDLTTNWAMKAGYRFVYGGRFKTQDYITDDPDNLHPSIPGSGNAANPWSGTLKNNEFYLGLIYTL